MRLRIASEHCQNARVHTATKTAALLALCAIALVGCGGQTPPGASPTTAAPTPSATTAATPAPSLTTATPAPGPTTVSPAPTTTASASGSPLIEPSPSPSVRDAAPLRSALLTLDDLPSRWRKASVEATSDAKIAPASCRAVMRPQDGLPKVTTATAGFQRGKEGPLLSHTVASSKDGLAAYVARLRATLPACRHFTAVSADGFTTKYETTLLSFPKKGDATVAFRTTGKIDGSDLSFGANVVMVAQGTALTALGAAGFDRQSNEVRLEPLLDKALRKLEAIQ